MSSSEYSGQPTRRARSAALATRARRLHSSRGDTTFKAFTIVCALVIAGLMLAITVALIDGAWPSMKASGFSFLWSSDWNVTKGQFGAVSPVLGTVATTVIAMLLALPMALVIALLLAELAHPRVSRVVGMAVEMLAAIPSIIYGMWGLFVVVPLMQQYVQPWVEKTPLGRIPLFSGPPLGVGLFTAGIILALMILPFITAVSRDVLQMVPTVVKEAGYGMGSTTWEVTRKISFRYGFGGFVGAAFIGLGRAFGETMAVLYVIGNEFRLPKSLFDPGVSIASAIAGSFAEAANALHRGALMEIGLILFLIFVIFQLVAELWLRRVNRRVGVR